MLNIPQDHKSIIYSFLDIKSLILLGSTCKTFHNEEIRIQTLIRKVVDTYFYCKSSYTGIIRNWMVLPYEKLFYEIYIDKLKKISFNHLELIKHPEYNSSVNQVDTVSNSDIIIHIFIDHILRLPIYERKQIYQNLFAYFKRLLALNEINRKHIKKLERYLYRDLRELFRYEKNREMKRLIISEVDKLIEISGAGGYDYTLKNFLFMNYEDVTDMIEIGEILLSINKKEECRDLFRHFIADMTGDVSTEHINDTYYQLKMPYRGVTYDRNFYEMIKNVDVELLEDFERWMKQIEDIVGSHY